MVSGRTTLGRGAMSTADESKQPAQERWRPTSRQIIAAVVVLAALLLITQNTNSGDFDFLWFDFRGPLWLLLLVVFGAGVGTGLLVARRRARRRSRA